MKLYGLIGNPLTHTRSAKLFQAIFRKLKLNSRYLLFEVEKRDLKNLILCMKLVDVYGLNMTMPYKQAVLPHLHQLDPSAKIAGAVNTIVRRQDKFIGYNTDGEGFALGLQEKRGFEPRGTCCTLLGAGGAARGIAAALARRGAQQIAFHNIHLRPAQKCCRDLKKHYPKTKWLAYRLLPKEVERTFPSADLLIQATPISPNIPLGPLSKDCLVADIVYHPIDTDFLKKARKRKLSTFDGLWMTLYQHLLNLKLWTGLSVDVNWMRRQVLG